MAYILFIDESGQDHSNSPYEVLAGMAVHDASLWDLIKEIKEIENFFFGDFYHANHKELKARKLLKRKTFNHAGQLVRMDRETVAYLAKQALTAGNNINRNQMTALAQAKLRYCSEILQVCQKYSVKLFASIIDFDAPQASLFQADISQRKFLRKDYSYLFERFYYFIDDQQGSDMGLITFDELERSKSHILVNQMSEYFLYTQKGKERSQKIIPEPFFVHSDLTTGIQLADLTAYLLSWGFRINNMKKEKRDELQSFVDTACALRHKTSRIIWDINRTRPVDVWSIAVIDH